jgi:transposase
VTWPSRTQVVCRLHAVLCELVPGGVPKKIIAAHAARLLDTITPPDAVAAARWELAAALIEDLRRIDGQLRETRKKLDTAVRASGTSLTGLFGAGPVIAAAVIGEVRDVSRFKNRDRFAAYNGTAPIEVSSGGRRVHRLSRRRGAACVPAASFPADHRCSAASRSSRCCGRSAAPAARSSPPAPPAAPSAPRSPPAAARSTPAAR